MKLKDLLKENWDVKDGKVLSNGKLVGYYEFDRDSDSFWVDDVKKGKGQLSFDTKKEVEDYFKKNEKDALNHLGKLRESVNEEKVYIDYLNKKKGFKQDRIKFNSYQDAVKWGRKNFDKFDPDMIKYESLSEATMHPMTREGALDNLKDVILNIKPYSREVVKLCEKAIAIIEKFETR
jgi:hypothetical protein